MANKQQNGDEFRKHSALSGPRYGLLHRLLHLVVF